jgi:hypothetical protein
MLAVMRPEHSNCSQQSERELGNDTRIVDGMNDFNARIYWRWRFETPSSSLSIRLTALAYRIGILYLSTEVIERAWIVRRLLI